jgi:hypothetical protein
MYRLPAIGCVVFGPATASEETQEEDEQESEAPDWRHWF